MIKAKNFSITYKKTGLKALNRINFEVKKGEILAILGPSGCGKTTLLNYIQQLLSPEEIKTSGSFNMYSDIIVRTVFQEPRLLPWKNILDNVLFGLECQKNSRESAQDEARLFLKIVGLKNYENYYPSQLSVGMQQRVNLARALVCNPNLLLMDEPFSALDESTKQGIIREFKEIIIKNKITTIFVTHNPKEAAALAHRSITIAGEFIATKEYKNKKSFDIDSFDYFWGAE